MDCLGLTVIAVSGRVIYIGEVLESLVSRKPVRLIPGGFFCAKTGAKKGQINRHL